MVYIAGYGLKRNTGRNRATREKAAALEEIIGENAFRFYFPAFIANGILGYFSLLFFDLKILIKTLFLPRQTVIVERQCFLPLSNALLRMRRIRRVQEVHADMADEIHLLQKNSFEKIILGMFAAYERRALKTAGGIICNNPVLKQKIAERCPAPCIVVYNGVHTEDFKVMDRAACREILQLDTRGRYFLFSGMISRWHGVEKLLAIFKREEMKDFTLLLPGALRNNYVNALKKDAAGYENIVFIDPVPADSIARYINAADICLLPVNDNRTSPGNPLKLYEYAACGKPVITQRDTPGYSDEVEKYQLGGTTDFSDAAEAAKYLIRFFNSLEPERYILNNRLAAEKFFSWKMRMQQWIEFIF